MAQAALTTTTVAMQRAAITSNSSIWQRNSTEDGNSINSISNENERVSEHLKSFISLINDEQSMIYVWKQLRLNLTDWQRYLTEINRSCRVNYSKLMLFYTDDILSVSSCVVVNKRAISEELMLLGKLMIALLCLKKKLYKYKYITSWAFTKQCQKLLYYAIWNKSIYIHFFSHT